MASSQKVSKTVDQYNARGARKTAGARVYLKRASGDEGKITIIRRRKGQVGKAKSLEEYFSRLVDQNKVKDPFKVVGMENKFDTLVILNGGGTTGQAEAVRHGISHALIKYDEEFATEEKQPETVVEKVVNTFRRLLRAAGFVTRDSRAVERKKVGHRKARKVEQYSKR